VTLGSKGEVNNHECLIHHKYNPNYHPHGKFGGSPTTGRRVSAESSDSDEQLKW